VTDYPFKVIVDNWPLFASGLVVTLQISVLSLLLSILLGGLLGVLRVAPAEPLRRLSGAYVEFFRNVPPLIHLFYVFFALPRVGIVMSSFTCGVLGLTVYHAAFVAEILRAGINAVGRHQVESARALGFNYVDSMRYIILPQALAIVLPPLGNLFISLVKTSSLVAAISATDLMYQAEVLNERSFRAFEVFGFAGLLYLSLTLSLGALIHRLEALLPVRRMA
jgi:aspartate/glutamate/glutamine transport system permease protein